jgi:hypothetical protein
MPTLSEAPPAKERPRPAPMIPTLILRSAMQAK